MASPPGSLYARGFAADAETERALKSGLSGREVRIQRGRFPDDLAPLLALLDSRVELDAEGRPFDIEPEISPEQFEGVCVAADSGVSFISYPRSGALPPPPSEQAVGAFLRYLANRAHVVLVAGVVDPDTCIGIMRRADMRVLVYEPTLSSISAAVHCLAMLGPDCTSTMVQCHSRMRRSALSPAQIRYALAERRPDIVVPFEPALHAAAVGDKGKRPPGKTYRAATRQLLERTTRSPAPGAS